MTQSTPKIPKTNGTVRRKRTAAQSGVDALLAKQRHELARLDALHNTLVERVALLVEGVETMKDVSDAAAALDKVGRITDRLIALERQTHGLDHPGTIQSSIEADFANLLRKAWERAYGTPPPDAE